MLHSSVANPVVSELLEFFSGVARFDAKVFTPERGTTRKFRLGAPVVGDGEFTDRR